MNGYTAMDEREARMVRDCYEISDALADACVEGLGGVITGDVRLFDDQPGFTISAMVSGMVYVVRVKKAGETVDTDITRLGEALRMASAPAPAAAPPR